MRRSTRHRSLLIQIAAGALAAAGLVLAPQAAFAQRGGHGGGGGGHFGGGGGGHYSGGGSSHAPSAPKSNGKPSGSSVSTDSSVKKTFAPPAPSGGSTSASSGVATGFVPFGSPAVAATAGSGAASATPHSTIGFPPVSEGSGLSTPIRPGARSFSGQGHEIWQDSPSESSRTTQPFSATTLGTKAVPFQQPAIFRSRRFYPVFYPSFGFYPFLGLGWGCDPFSPFAWNFGCNGLGFGYGYGYGYYGGGYYNAYPGWSSGSVQGGPQSDSSGDYGPSTWSDAPADDSNSQSNSSGNSAAPESVIYLRDGSSFSVADYWVADGQLFYVTSHGTQNSVNLKLFDIERTTNENASRGITITLRPAPTSLTPTPDQDTAPKN